MKISLGLKQIAQRGGRKWAVIVVGLIVVEAGHLAISWGLGVSPNWLHDLHYWLPGAEPVAWAFLLGPFVAQTVLLFVEPRWWFMIAFGATVHMFYFAQVL